MNGLPSSDVLHWDEIAPVELRAVPGNGVDLLGGVSAPSEPIWTAPGRVHADEDCPALERRPFALHTDRRIWEVEEQVVSAVLCNRLQDIDAELDGVRRDHRLRHGALVIGRVHERMFASRTDTEGSQPSGMRDEATPSYAGS